MEKDSKIYVAGHRGMVGSAIVRELERQGYGNIVTRTHGELDLRNQTDVEKFFEEEKPEYVFLTAAKVGGIAANQSAPADFLYDNTMIEMNVMRSAWENGIKKLEFISTASVYPDQCPQPMKEEYLLTGKHAPAHEAYALAKISGMRLCEYLRRQHDANFISLTPCNLYGVNDNYDVNTSHVLPAMIRRFHDAKENGKAEVTCWGDGTVHRDFLYADDLANACVYFMDHYDGSETVNIGSGRDVTIKEIAETVASIVGYEGKINWDTSKPNGKAMMLLDVSKANALGWESKTTLEKGIRLAYEDFLARAVKMPESRNNSGSRGDLRGNSA